MISLSLGIDQPQAAPGKSSAEGDVQTAAILQTGDDFASIFIAAGANAPKAISTRPLPADADLIVPPPQQSDATNPVEFIQIAPLDMATQSAQQHGDLTQIPAESSNVALAPRLDDPASKGATVLQHLLGPAGQAMWTVWRSDPPTPPTPVDVTQPPPPDTNHPEEGVSESKPKKIAITEPVIASNLPSAGSSVPTMLSQWSLMMRQDPSVPAMTPPAMQNSEETAALFSRTAVTDMQNNRSILGSDRGAAFAPNPVLSGPVAMAGTEVQLSLQTAGQTQARLDPLVFAPATSNPVSASKPESGELAASIAIETSPVTQIASDSLPSLDATDVHSVNPKSERGASYHANPANPAQLHSRALASTLSPSSVLPPLRSESDQRYWVAPTPLTNTAATSDVALPATVDTAPADLPLKHALTSPIQHIVSNKPLETMSIKVETAPKTEAANVFPEDVTGLLPIQGPKAAWQFVRGLDQKIPMPLPDAATTLPTAAKAPQNADQTSEQPPVPTLPAVAAADPAQTNSGKSDRMAPIAHAPAAPSSAIQPPAPKAEVLSSEQFRVSASDISPKAPIQLQASIRVAQAPKTQDDPIVQMATMSTPGLEFAPLGVPQDRNTGVFALTNKPDPIVKGEISTDTVGLLADAGTPDSATTPKLVSLRADKSVQMETTPSRGNVSPTTPPEKQSLPLDSASISPDAAAFSARRLGSDVVRPHPTPTIPIAKGDSVALPVEPAIKAPKIAAQRIAILPSPTEPTDQSATKVISTNPRTAAQGPASDIQTRQIDHTNIQEGTLPVRFRTALAPDDMATSPPSTRPSLEPRVLETSDPWSTLVAKPQSARPERQALADDSSQQINLSPPRPASQDSQYPAVSIQLAAPLPGPTTETDFAPLLPPGAGWKGTSPAQNQSQPASAVAMLGEPQELPEQSIEKPEAIRRGPVEVQSAGTASMTLATSPIATSSTRSVAPDAPSLPVATPPDSWPVLLSPDRPIAAPFSQASAISAPLDRALPDANIITKGPMDSIPSTSRPQTEATQTDHSKAAKGPSAFVNQAQLADRPEPQPNTFEQARPAVRRSVPSAAAPTSVEPARNPVGSRRTIQPGTFKGRATVPHTPTEPSATVSRSSTVVPIPTPSRSAPSDPVARTHTPKSPETAEKSNLVHPNIPKDIPSMPDVRTDALPPASASKPATQATNYQVSQASPHSETDEPLKQQAKPSAHMTVTSPAQSLASSPAGPGGIEIASEHPKHQARDRTETTSRASTKTNSAKHGDPTLNDDAPLFPSGDMAISRTETDLSRVPDTGAAPPSLAPLPQSQPNQPAPQTGQLSAPQSSSIQGTAPPGKITSHEARRLPHGVSTSLVKAASRAGKNDKVELTLDPVELGKVRFDFTTTGDRLQVNLSVERGETLDLLRRNVEQLRTEFRDAGFDGPTLSFSQWSQQGGDTQTAQRPLDDAEAVEFTAVTPEPSPSRNKTSTGHGLDLRL